MAEKSINVALIGSKFMGRAHANAYLKVSKFFDLPIVPVMHTLVARDPKQTQAFARRWGWRNFSTDWRQAVRDSEIHLVDVTSPNNAHAEHAIAALEAGKHVACEKPLAHNLDHARQMMQAAKKAKKCRTFVWYNYRRCPAVALAYQLAREGKLGRIYHVRAAYLQDWAGPDTPLMWRFQKEVSGSGALGDLCAHSIDMARFITGQEIVQIAGALTETFIKERHIIEAGGGEISGRGGKVARKKGRSTVDDAVLFIGRMSGGAVASFEATRLSTGDKNRNRMEIHGDKGAVRFDFERMNELEWYDATLPGRLQGWSTINATNGNEGHPYAGAWWPVAHILGYEHSFVNMVADMMTALAGQKPLVPLVDFQDAYQTQRVLAAVLKSEAERRPVALSEVK